MRVRLISPRIFSSLLSRPAMIYHPKHAEESQTNALTDSCPALLSSNTHRLPANSLRMAQDQRSRFAQPSQGIGNVPRGPLEQF